MSEDLDSYFMSVAVAMSQNQIDIDGAAELLLKEGVIDRVDGGNIQQLIRVSLMMSRVDPTSASVAKVAALLCILKDGLEIDFGLQVGVANAQSCAWFTLFNIALEQDNLLISLATLQSMVTSLKTANDKKGLLEALCWEGILSADIEDYESASKSYSMALALLDEADTADELLDDSSLDMVRADNVNVFSFPLLKFLQNTQVSDIRDALNAQLDALPRP